MSIRTLTRPLLSPNQRVAAGLLLAAAGGATARATASTDGPAGAIVGGLGRGPACLLDAMDDLRVRMALAKEERIRAREREWLRANTKPARLHVQTY